MTNVKRKIVAVILGFFALMSFALFTLNSTDVFAVKVDAVKKVELYQLAPDPESLSECYVSTDFGSNNT